MRNKSTYFNMAALAASFSLLCVVLSLGDADFAPLGFFLGGFQLSLAIEWLMMFQRHKQSHQDLDDLKKMIDHNKTLRDMLKAELEIVRSEQNGRN